jgi:hypothetical protein
MTEKRFLVTLRAINPIMAKVDMTKQPIALQSLTTYTVSGRER